MNNKSKINTLKGKIYFTVAALAAILMMSINLNANMNSNMNAYATIMSEIPNIDDIGQSAECVIVVVGCDGTGSVGSSGDTIIGSFNGNDDNNTDTNGETPFDPNTPLPPVFNCEPCLNGALSDDQRIALGAALEVANTSSLSLCQAITAQIETVGQLVELLDEAGLSAQEIVELLNCFEIAITLADVDAILAV
jgi:hypothetical protein